MAQIDNIIPEMSFDISKFKIPDEFHKVIKKLHPEIEMLEITAIEEIDVYSHFSSLHKIDFTHKFKISITIHFNYKSPSLSMDGYSNSLNQGFLYTYGESDFVTFKVNKFNLPKEKTSTDKFMELFYVGK